MSGPSEGEPPLEIIRLAENRVPGLAIFMRDLKEVGDDAFFSPHASDEESIRRMIRATRSDLFYLAVEGEKVLAYGLLRGWDEGFAIPSLGIAVHPAAKGAGLGRLLMNFLHLAAIRKGTDTVRLRVHGDNVGAIALYRSLGYTFDADPGKPGYLLGLLSLKTKHAA